MAGRPIGGLVWVSGALHVHGPQRLLLLRALRLRQHRLAMRSAGGVACMGLRGRSIPVRMASHLTQNASSARKSRVCLTTGNARFEATISAWYTL